MSVEAMTWAFSVPIGGNAKLVLLGLANHAGAEFTEARPAVSTLARYAHCSERTVQRSLRELEAGGWIEKTGDHPVAGRPDRTVNVWRLTGRQTVTPYGVTNPARGDIAGTKTPERGDTAGQNGVTPVSPEPSLGTVHRKTEPPKTSLSAVADEKSRPDVDFLCHLLGTLMLMNDPKAKPRTDSETWRQACRLLLDRDGRSVEEVERVLRWSQADSFWKANILSMPKLRDKFPQLALKMSAEARKPGGSDDPWSTENILAAGRRLSP